MRIIVFLIATLPLFGQVPIGGVSTSGGGGGGSGVGADGIVVTSSAGVGSATAGSRRLGNVVYTLAAGCTLTPTSGTGTAFFYMTSAGVFTWGHNVTATGSGTCTVAGGVSAFPDDSLPFSSCVVTAGVLGTCTTKTNVGRDVTVAGTGLSESTTNGIKTLSYSPASLVGPGYGWLYNIPIWPGFTNAVTTQTMVNSANQTRCHQMIVPAGGATIDRIGYQVTTGSGAGTAARIIIWDSTGTTRLIDSGALTGTNVTATGPKVITVSTTVLPAGPVMASWTADNTTTAVSTYNSSGANAMNDVVLFFGNVGANSFFSTARGGLCTASTGSSTTLDMGATLGAPATGTFPPMLFVLFAN